jgi:DnaJ-class molecular chaperone
MGTVMILLGLAGTGGWYGYIRYFQPTRICRKCGGTGWKRIPLLRDAWRPCAVCDGTGETLRRGARRSSTRGAGK